MCSKPLAVFATLLCTAISPQLAAHGPYPPLEGTGTALVDGAISPGEWDAAGRLDFLADVPPEDGGGTTPATLLVMTDETHLYLAVTLDRPSFGGVTQPIFEFDNDHDGVMFEPGDDIVSVPVGLFQAVEFFDVFRFPCDGSDAGFAGCSGFDTGFGGTSDGTAAAGNDGVLTVIEISHPLDSLDDAHDFSLVPGATLGFQLTLHLGNLDPAFCNTCFTDTILTGDILVAGGPAGPADPVAVTIDVRPGSDFNPVNVADHGVTPVAILGSPVFDATSVDPLSVCFGDAEAPEQRDCTEAHAAGHPEDVNADGLPDLVLHFEISETGIDEGDSQACLTGHTFGGALVEGCDAIRATAPAAQGKSSGPARGGGAGSLGLGGMALLLGIGLSRCLSSRTPCLTPGPSRTRPRAPRESGSR